MYGKLDLPLFWQLQGKYCSTRSNGTSKQSFSVNYVSSGAEDLGEHPWSPIGGRSMSGFSPVVSELDLWGIGLPERTVFKTGSSDDFMGPHDSIIFKWIFSGWSHWKYVPDSSDKNTLCALYLSFAPIHQAMIFLALPYELQTIPDAPLTSFHLVV